MLLRAVALGGDWCYGALPVLADSGCQPHPTTGVRCATWLPPPAAHRVWEFGVGEKNTVRGRILGHWAILGLWVGKEMEQEHVFWG
jgi:hypothetical protein